MYRYFFKRIIDFMAALVGLLLLSPVFVMIYLVLLVMYKGGSPFFIQERPGKDEKIFRIIKFRTMSNKKDKDGNLLSDAERLSTVGDFIRKVSLDEIPQLINVIKGDMSLVGPRPLLPEYLSLYSDFQRQRHRVRPGITGWAQVNGRNLISWTKKFEYDVWYVKNITAILDLRILLRTIRKVFKKEGISSKTHVTIEDFNGMN